jgi:hypothetical protein
MMTATHAVRELARHFDYLCGSSPERVKDFAEEIAARRENGELATALLAALKDVRSKPQRCPIGVP